MSPTHARHAELALQLATDDQRLLDMLAQRPHLLHPYPSIITRLSRRSRKFRRQIAERPVLRRIPLAERATHLRLVVPAGPAA